MLRSVAILLVLILSVTSAGGHAYTRAGNAASHPENATLGPYPYSDGKLAKFLTGSSFNAPASIAFDPRHGYLYVTNAGWDNITILNASTSAVLGSISGFHYPYTVSYDSYSNYLIVQNEEAPYEDITTNTSIYDLSSNRIVMNLSYNGFPFIVSNPRNGELFEANGTGISVISGSNWSAVSLNVSRTSITDLYYDSPRNLLLVGASNYTLYLINASTYRVIQAITVAPVPPYNQSQRGEPNGIYDITTDQTGSIAYFFLSYEMLAFNLDTFRSVWKLNNSWVEAGYTIFDPLNNLLYVSDFFGVYGVDASTGNIFVQFDGGGITRGDVFDPANGAVYVAEGSPGYLLQSGIPSGGLLIITETYTPAVQSDLFLGFELAGIALVALFTVLFFRKLYRKE